MKKTLILQMLLFAFVSCEKQIDGDDPVVAEGSKWISEVLEYRPAPGQFINQSIGSENSPLDIVGKKGTLTLGGFGGYVVFRFGNAVMNQSGNDFVIHGNPFSGSSEAGIVMVSADANNNGIADDKWYELKGTANESKIIKNYEITYYKPSQTETAESIKWIDNSGLEGEIGVSSDNGEMFHKQSYYPLFVDKNASSLTFKGNCVNAKYEIDAYGIYALPSIGEGYADNYSKDYVDIINGDENTKFSNKFDISNAVDDNGNKIKFDKIDFIKVYNCLNTFSPILGEASTEICGAISLTSK